MRAFFKSLMNFCFLRLSLETGCGGVAVFIGAHWMYWRTFDLPPYRMLVRVATAAQMPGEFFWGIPLSLLGAAQLAGSWSSQLIVRRVASRLLAMYLVLLSVIMMITLPRAILAWLFALGAYGQLAVFFQLPLLPRRVNGGRLCCHLFPVVPILAEGGFDHETTTYLGIAAVIAIMVIPAIGEVRRWFTGGEKSNITVSPMPVFAPVAMVERVDQELRAKVEKLDVYVHSFVHDQGNAMGSISRQIIESEESQRKAIADVNKQGEERITKVHDRLNEVVRDLGGLDTNAQNANQQLAAMRQTLEVLLSRTAPQRRGGLQS